MSKHTAGPLSVDEFEEDGKFLAVVSDRDGGIMATCECHLGDEEAVEFTRGDAHLYAASPALLSALTTAVRWCPGCDGSAVLPSRASCPVCSEARTALAAARGEK